MTICYCPYCTHVLDAHVATDDIPDGPDPGDFSGCAYCGGALVFTETLGLRVPTLEERKEWERLARRRYQN